MLISRRNVLSALPLVALPAIAQAAEIPRVDAKGMFEHRHVNDTVAIFSRPEGSTTFQVGYDNTIWLVQKPQRVIVLLDYWKYEDETPLQNLLEAFVRCSYATSFKYDAPRPPDRCFHVEAKAQVPASILFSQGPVGYFLTDDKGRRGAILFTHRVLDRHVPFATHSNVTR